MSDFTEHLTIGISIFEAQAKKLLTGEMILKLTYKESKLLLLLAQHPNQIIEHSFLQNKIWKDEGVIVGRSLDVFISK